MRLSSLIRGIGSLERDSATALTPAQARAISAVVAPWSKKPRMTETEANALHARLTNLLTANQKSVLAQRGPGGAGGPGRGGEGPRDGARRGGGWGGPEGERRGGSPRGEGGWGGPGGGPRGGGPGGPPSAQDMQKMRQSMQKMQTFVKTTYNPFYAPANYKELKELPERMQEGFKRRHAMQQATLNRLAAKAKMKS
jgi:hypothetical protein